MTLDYVGSGLYDIGADAPHTRPVYFLLKALRERSIDEHAKSVRVPPMDDPKMIADGAAHYAEMCTGCHLPTQDTSRYSTADLYTS